MGFTGFILFMIRYVLVARKCSVGMCVLIFLFECFLMFVKGVWCVSLCFLREDLFDFVAQWLVAPKQSDKK